MVDDEFVDEIRQHRVVGLFAIYKSRKLQHCGLFACGTWQLYSAFTQATDAILHNGRQQQHRRDEIFVKARGDNGQQIGMIRRLF